MKIILSKPLTTCIALEQELGLSRGDILRITTFEDGSVEIETSKDLTPDQMSKLEAARGRGMRITATEGK